MDVDKLDRVHRAVQDVQRFLRTAYWSRLHVTRMEMLTDAIVALRDALDIEPPAGSLLALMMGAQTVHARSRGYRDAATRYNPERSEDL